MYLQNTHSYQDQGNAAHGERFTSRARESGRALQGDETKAEGQPRASAGCGPRLDHKLWPSSQGTELAQQPKAGKGGKYF